MNFEGTDRGIGQAAYKKNSATSRTVQSNLNRDHVVSDYIATEIFRM